VSNVAFVHFSKNRGKNESTHEESILILINKISSFQKLSIILINLFIFVVLIFKSEYF